MQRNSPLKLEALVMFINPGAEKEKKRKKSLYEHLQLVEYKVDEQFCNEE